MTTLTPVGKGRNGGLWQIVVAVVVALVVGIGGGILYTQHNNNNAAAPAAGSSCSPSAKASTKPSTKPAVKLPAPSTITVNVYNATNRKGLAKSTSGDLVARGFIAGKVANDPLKKTIAGSAEIRYGTRGGRQREGGCGAGRLAQAGQGHPQGRDGGLRGRRRLHRTRQPGAGDPGALAEPEPHAVGELQDLRSLTPTG